MPAQPPDRPRGPTWQQRVHLDGFWFWRADNLGGPLPSRPPERLDLSGIWHLLGYLRYAWLGTAGLLVTIFASAYVGVLPAFVIRHIVNVDLRTHSLPLLLADGTRLAELFLLLALIHALNGWCGAWASSVVVYRLRAEVWRRQLHLPLDRLLGRGAAATMVRTVNEVGVAGGDSPVFTGIAGIINTVAASINNVVTLVSAVIAMFILNGHLALVSLVLLPIPIAVGLWWGRIVYGAVHRQYEKLTELTGFLLRSFSPVAAWRDKLLGRQRELEADFRRRNRELTNASIYARVLFHWYDNLFAVIHGVTVGLVWLVGGHDVLGGVVSLGTVLATITLINRLDGPVHNLAELWFSLRSLAAVADRVAADLEAAPAETPVGPAPGAGTPSPAAATGPGTLRAEGVRVTAGGRAFLAGLDLTLGAGEVLTVLDESPGRAAPWLWAAVLSGWYPPAEGHLTLAGAPLRPGVAAVLAPEVPVPGLSATRLWERAGGPGAAARGAELWQGAAERCGRAVSAPDPDAPLDGADVTAQQRLLAGVVAAQLRGAAPWLVVGEPEGLGVRWSAFGPPVVRIQPEGHTLSQGDPWIGRRASGVLEEGHGTPEWWARRQPDAGASDGWSTEVLAGDGPGWWASLGLRRHASAQTGRFVEPFRHLFVYMARYWVYWLTILVLGSGAAAVTTAVSPLLSRRIIDVGIGKHDPRTLTVAALLLMALAILSGLFNIAFTTTLVQTGGKRMCGDIRDDFFGRLVRTPLGFLRARGTAEINSRAINDVNAVFSGTDAIIKMVTWMVIPKLPSMVLLWVLGWRYGLLTLAIAAPFAALSIWAGRLNARLQERLFAVVGAMTSEVHAVGSGARATLLRASGLEREAEAVGERLNLLLYRLGFAQYLRANWWATVESLWGNATTVLFWVVGGTAILHGHLLLGTLVAVMTYAGTYVGMGGAVDSYVAIHGICSNLDRLQEYGREGVEPLDGAAPALPGPAAVTLRSPGRAEPLDLVLRPGEVATVRGEHASAVRDALLQLGGQDAVRVELGGRDAATLPADAWRRSVGWVCADYPFGEATLAQLLAWATGPGGDPGPALEVLGVPAGTPELERTAEEWLQGEPERALRLSGALAVAARARLVLVEAAPDAASAITGRVRPHVPEAAVLRLEPV